MGEHHALDTRPPTEPERQLIHHTLVMFTPWGSSHVSGSASDRSILETHCDGTSDCSDWDRFYALIDPICGGFPRLIREYNQYFPMASGAGLEDPGDTLEIPCYHPGICVRYTDKWEVHFYQRD
jgi:hypothetical protein